MSTITFSVIESTISGLNDGTVSVRSAVAALAAFAAANGQPFSESVARRTKAQCIESAFKLRTAIETKLVAERKRLPQPTITAESIRATVEQLAAEPVAEAAPAKPAKSDAEVRDEAFAPVSEPKAEPKAKAPAKPRRGAPAEAFEPEAKPTKPAKVSRFGDSTSLVVLVREALYSADGLAIKPWADANAAKLGTNADKLNKEVRNVIDRLRSRGEKIARVANATFRAAE
jgi:hypothetical protein